jgi:6-phosphogluconolactonase
VDNQTSLQLAVGCYSEVIGHAPNARGAGVQILEIDLSSAAATTAFQYEAIANPAFLQPHPTMPVLYVVSEVYGGRPGAVNALRFTAGWTELVSRTELLSQGVIPSYVSVAGDFLLLSNYGDGSLVSFRLGPEGDLVEPVSMVRLSGSGPQLDRQDGPHAHCVLPHPYNGCVYAADLGADLLLRLTLDPDNGHLAIVGGTKLAAGAGPRHLVFTPSGNQALVVEELSSTLAVLDVMDEGELVLRQRLSLLPNGFDGDSTGADIVMHPSGAVAFASNRGDDSVVRFDLGADGWAATSWKPVGTVPRGLALSPDGMTLVVANQESDNLQVLDVNGTGPAERFTLPTATPTAARFLR